MTICIKNNSNRRFSHLLSLKPYCGTQDYNDRFQDRILDKPSLCDRLCRILDHWPVTRHHTIPRNVACDAISHERLLVLATIYKW